MRAGAFLAVRLAVDFRAAVFLVVRLAALRAGAFLAVRLAVDFRAAVLRAGAFLAVRLAGAFLAVRFRAGAFFVAFLAVALRAAVFLAGALRTALLAAFFTAIDSPSLGFNADLNAEPVANRTPFDAGIGTASPVLGFRPTRGPRVVGLNAPNPITVTFRPDRTSATIVSNNTSTTSSTVRRDARRRRTDCLHELRFVHDHLLSDTQSLLAKWLFTPRSSTIARRRGVWSPAPRP